MYDIIRDSTLGLILNSVSHGRLAQYPEQQQSSGFQLPPTTAGHADTSTPSPERVSKQTTPSSSGRGHSLSEIPTLCANTPDAEINQEKTETLKDLDKALTKSSGGDLIDWYNEQDAENPQ